MDKAVPTPMEHAGQRSGGGREARRSRLAAIRAAISSLDVPGFRPAQFAGVSSDDGSFHELLETGFDLLQGDQSDLPACHVVLLPVSLCMTLTVLHGNLTYTYIDIYLCNPGR